MWGIEPLLTDKRTRPWVALKMMKNISTKETDSVDTTRVDLKCKIQNNKTNIANNSIQRIKHMGL